MDIFIIYWLLGIIVVPGIIFAGIAQAKIFSTYNTYKQRPASCGKTADVVAREILDKNEFENVIITHSNGGDLSDHYNPTKETIGLSNGVYSSDSIAALSVAAHEVGHAIQRKEGYFASKIRSFLVPVVNFCSVMLWPLVIIGVIINIGAAWDSFVGNLFLWLGIAFFGVSVLFSLITLPTELDASKRAMVQLQEGGYITTEEEITGAKKVLRAAAMTYVASLVVSILNLVRFILAVWLARE